MIEIELIHLVSLLGGALVLGLGLWYALRRRLGAVARLGMEEWREVAAAREAQIDDLEAKVDALSAQVGRLEGEIKALRSLQAQEIAAAAVRLAATSPELALARREQSVEIARLVVEQVSEVLASRPRLSPKR